MGRHVSSTVGNNGLKIIRCLGLDYLNTLGYFRSKRLKNAEGRCKISSVLRVFTIP